MNFVFVDDDVDVIIEISRAFHQCQLQTAAALHPEREWRRDRKRQLWPGYTRHQFLVKH